jgi:LysR family transcriptional regulator, glycine cleavage system transcriptional activator
MYYYSYSMRNTHTIMIYVIVLYTVNMRKIPPLNAIKAFEAAGRHNSFTRASEELCVSHGAISKQVALLEAWLNTKLFTRTQSQLEITPAGKTLLGTITPAFDRIALTAMQLMEDVTPPAVLNVNAPPTFTMRWLIPRISSFQKKYPETEIKLTTSTEPINFLEFNYDIAIRGSHVDLGFENAIPFMTETIIPICHPDLVTGSALKDPEAINQFTVISYGTEPMKWSEWASSTQLKEFKPKNILQFEQMYFALQAASEGLGIVLVPLFLVADDIANGKLCAPFGTLGARQREYYAVSRMNQDEKPVIKEFCNWINQESIQTEEVIKGLLPN